MKLRKRKIRGLGKLAIWYNAVRDAWRGTPPADSEELSVFERKLVAQVNEAIRALESEYQRRCRRICEALETLPARRVEIREQLQLRYRAELNSLQRELVLTANMLAESGREKLLFYQQVNQRWRKKEDRVVRFEQPLRVEFYRPSLNLTARAEELMGEPEYENAVDLYGS